MLPAVVGILLAALLIEVIYVWVKAGDYYAIAPGTAPVVSDSANCKPAGGGTFSLPGGRPCVRLVLPPGHSGGVEGTVFMVDVLVGKATAWDYFLHQVGQLHRFEDGTVLYTNQEILGSTPASQYSCQNTQEMTDATEAAQVVALRKLGYSVGEHDLGAQIDEVAASTPAASAGFECNDLITGFDGRPIATFEQLVAAIHASAPGAAFSATVSRLSGAHEITVHLQGRLSGTPAESGAPAQPSRAFLGITTETRSQFHLPFQVSIHVGQIGGPSAGLALTLAVLDSLDNGSLTAGHRIAATGTIDLDGNVGDVGGVAQKTVAVRRAGAQIFFVPLDEASQARGEAGSMKIYPVSTLAQALSVLEGMGGRLPMAAT